MRYLISTLMILYTATGFCSADDNVLGFELGKSSMEQVQQSLQQQKAMFRTHRSGLQPTITAANWQTVSQLGERPLTTFRFIKGRLQGIRLTWQSDSLDDIRKARDHFQDAYTLKQTPARGMVGTHHLVSKSGETQLVLMVKQTMAGLNLYDVDLLMHTAKK